MTGKKNSRLVTVELDLEAYKAKNKSLSEHLIKVQQEKAQAYQELNTLRQQYLKLHKKYCCIKNLVQHNMRDNIALLTKHQERFNKFFMEENDTTAESSMKSNESRNRSASLHDNRSRRSALNSNDGSWDSLSEGVATKVVTTRKKYNSDKENSSKGPALTNANASLTQNGLDNTSRMAEVQVNIRKRRGAAEDDRKSGRGTDQDLWDVDVRLRAGDSNTNGNSDSSDDDNEEEEDDDDEEKLDTIQEEDEEYNYWSESAKRLRLMVTERKSVPAPVVDADSSMACQLDESVIDRTNAFVARESVSPVERRRRMADKYNHTSNVSTSMALEETAATSTARQSALANVSEDFPDLSNSSRLFMMKSLNLRDMSNADPLRNDISFQTSTPFGEISPRLRARSNAESATPSSPCTILNRGSATTNSSESSSATMHPKRMFTESENRTSKTSGRGTDRPNDESSSSSINLKRGNSKKLANAVVPVEQRMTNKTKSKSKSKNSEEEESNNEVEATVCERDSKTNRKAYSEESQNEAETSPDECEEKENRSENTSGKHSRKFPKRRQAEQSAASEVMKISKSKAKSNAKSEIETTTEASDDESTLIENQEKYKCAEDTSQKVPIKNRKRMMSKSKVDKPITVKRLAKHAKCENEATTESPCDNSSTSESEDIEKSIENHDQQSNTKASTRKRQALGPSSDNDSTDADPTWKDEGAATTSSGDETLTEADNEPKHGVRQGGGITARKRLGRLPSKENKKEIKVVLDRAEIKCYTTTTGQLVQQIKERTQAPVKTKKEQLKLKGTPDISSAGMGDSEQQSSSALKKVKRLNQVQRYVDMKKNSPRPMRAARPSKPLCESSLKKKMRRSK